ncbi:Aste57867_18561 [Aphanomyces stellatus]|uniref:Aste57867_18561 protein n=1 Tax=Aphanomyces stellatus TaxID=120398 RepID=A0A485LAF3_9STRA|nr:hypothetical protein As57867_018499 [Aphanomyces stellatus]VFT95297.1 Aste57867_18561 [Aphanomyces stellatus]
MVDSLPPSFQDEDGEEDNASPVSDDRASAWRRRNTLVWTRLADAISTSSLVNMGDETGEEDDEDTRDDGQHVDPWSAFWAAVELPPTARDFSLVQMIPAARELNDEDVDDAEDAYMAAVIDCISLIHGTNMWTTTSEEYGDGHVEHV